MITVWKYPFAVRDRVEIVMPRGAEILLVADQDGAACIWARVCPNRPTETRTFVIFGTGYPILPGGNHVGSFQQGPFVWHVFEDVS